jgi:predicted nucleic acid-binding protein
VPAGTPKDDKFLELAIEGEARAIISGDDDLLALHPFRGTPILTPAAFVIEQDPSEGDSDERSERS